MKGGGTLIMAKIISVVSGKGGTGKSTLSAALSKSLASSNRKVLAIDLDIGLRSLDILLSLENKIVFDFGDILDGKCSIDAAIVPHDSIETLFLLSSPNVVSKSFSIQGIISLIKSLSKSFDFIILDMPAGLGISIIMARELADLNLVVTVPDEITLRDTRKISDAISTNTARPSRLIINRVSKNALLSSGINDLDEMIDSVGIPLLGVIPEDEWINSTIPQKKPTKNSIITSKIFDAIGERINGHYVPLILRQL